MYTYNCLKYSYIRTFVYAVAYCTKRDESQRPLIVVMNVPIRKTSTDGWGKSIYPRRCIARTMNREREDLEKAMNCEERRLRSRALFKDLKVAIRRARKYTVDVNLPAVVPPRKIRNHPHAGTRSSSLSAVPEVADFSRFLSVALDYLRRARGLLSVRVKRTAQN